ncbi:hypothetical protein FGG08_004128, partial [Glutinoglossum americanum]
GHEAVARLLLEKGADAAVRDTSTSTALHHAARSGHEAVARLLLEKGVDVATEDGLGRTALHRAAGSGHETIVRLLLEKGADTAAEDESGLTAMYLAAESGHEAVARLLLGKGADVATKDKSGSTALQQAAASGHEVDDARVDASPQPPGARDTLSRESVQMIFYSGMTLISHGLVEPLAFVTSLVFPRQSRASFVLERTYRVCFALTIGRTVAETHRAVFGTLWRVKCSITPFKAAPIGVSAGTGGSVGQLSEDPFRPSPAERRREGVAGA